MLRPWDTISVRNQLYCHIFIRIKSNVEAGLNPNYALELRYEAWKANLPKADKLISDFVSEP
jgi:hypothetical protein